LALFVPATTCNAAPATPPGLDPAKAITQYVHDSWSTRDGLPNRRVSAIVQTRDGYLWIGTGAGLARFDGVRFAVFNSRTHPEIGNDDIRTLHEDADGALWIGTYGSGIVRFADGRFGGDSMRSSTPLLASASERHGPGGPAGLQNR